MAVMTNADAPVYCGFPVERRLLPAPVDIDARVRAELLEMHIAIDRKVSWLSAFPALFISIWALQSAHPVLATISASLLCLAIALNLLVLPQLQADANRLAGRKGELLALSDFLNGVFWGGAMLPVAPSIGTSVEASFVCMFIIVTMSLTAVTNRADQRALCVTLAGFAMALVPQTIYYFDVLGPIPLIATLLLVPSLILIGNALHKQIRSMVRTRIMNEHLSDELAKALRQAQYLSDRDSLTGLLNRRAFETRACEHQGVGVHALILIDLDHFKQINDTFGHSVGDEVLKYTADLIERRLRLNGWGHETNSAAARWGGEEFVIFLPECPEADAVRIAEDICRDLQKSKLRGWPTALSVSGSIGISRWADGQSLAQAIKNADAAMYSAKKAGRNQVFAYREMTSRPAMQVVGRAGVGQ
jgi:diguanylate cyclase (GGDEF)-like protein